MQVRVDINKVEIMQTEQVNSGEYNTRELQFNIAENMQGLNLKALFTKDYKTYEVDVENDSCMIPWEVLKTDGNCELGVYAYSVNGEVLEIRYSPEPTKFYINAGSYKTDVENGEEPTPTRTEVLEGKIKELDNKKVDKKEGYGLSQNDFTNELKTTLENLENYDDAEIREILDGNLKDVNYKASTGIMTFIKNDESKIEIDLPLELLIEDGKYDETTKQIILTLANGNVINIPLSDLLDDFYGTEKVDELLQEKQDQIDTLKAENQEQAEQINYLDKTLTRDEATGENINIKNSAEYPISNISIDTNIKQDSREGYNLLNFDVEQDSKVTVNDNGTITINGTGGFSLNFKEITLLTGKTYRQKYRLVSGSVTGANESSIFMSFSGDKWLSSQYGVNTTPTQDTNKNKAWIHANAIFNNATFEIWGYEGTDDKPYEQYGAMPSIEFPSEIKTPVGKQSIYVGNENSFIPSIKIDDTKISCVGATLTLIDDEYSFIVTAKDMYFGQVTSEGKEYTKNRGTLYNVKGKSKIYFLLTGDSLRHIYITFYNSDKISLGYKQIYSNKGNCDIPENAEYMTLRFGNASATIGETYKTKVMLAFEEITEYVKHQSQVQDLDLTSELLGPIVDKEDGSYFENRYERYVFDGTETIGRTKTNDGTYYYYYIDKINNKVYKPSANSEVVNIYSNKFKAVSSTSTGVYGRVEGISITTVGRIGIYSDVTKEMTVDEFKTWLQTANIEILYPLATPTYTKLTDEQQAQWNKIKKMHTYEGVTNIYTINENGISPVINMKYVKSPKVVEENLQAQIDKINSAIVALGAV